MLLVSLTGVHKHHALGGGTVAALAGVHLSIDHNEYVAIIGSSGSGKSTLLNLIGCLDTPTSGTYLLNGVDVATLRGSGLARIRNETMGFVFQAFHLLPRMNARDNVAQPLVFRGTSRAERRRRANEALARVGLADRAGHLPAQLSGGQRQRVAIARALVTEPALVLADEPTGNLDSASTDRVMALFDGIHREGRTVLVVTHEAEIAARCARSVELLDGRIVNDTRARTG